MSLPDSCKGPHCIRSLTLRQHVCHGPHLFQRSSIKVNTIDAGINRHCLQASASVCSACSRLICIDDLLACLHWHLATQTLMQTPCELLSHAMCGRAASKAGINRDAASSRHPLSAACSHRRRSAAIPRAAAAETTEHDRVRICDTVI